MKTDKRSRLFRRGVTILVVGLTWCWQGGPRRLLLALGLAVALLPLVPRPVAALSLSEYFQITYEPVLFSKSEITGTETFQATVRGTAVCSNDLPMTVSEARISSRVVARHTATGTEYTINSSYTVNVSPFPNRRGESTSIDQQIALRFPAGSQPGDYTVVGRLVKAEVRVMFWQNITSFLPPSRDMGSLKLLGTADGEVPVLSIGPPQMSFVAQVGANPTRQNVMLWNSGGGVLAWSASDDAGWLSLEPSAGTVSGETDIVNVSVNTAGMSVGIYTATIIVIQGDGTSSSKTVPVNLSLTSPQAPPSPPTPGTPIPPLPPVTPGQPSIPPVQAGLQALYVDPPSIGFSIYSDERGPLITSLVVWNSGGGSLNWSASSDANWLSLGPSAGILAGVSETITLKVDLSGMSPGTYKALVSISTNQAGSSLKTIPVDLAINKRPAGSVTIPVLSLRVEKVAIVTNSTWTGFRASATARVKVVDKNGPVSGAVVLGHWTGAAEGSYSATTDSEGMALVTSETVWNGSGSTFTFLVDSVSINGWKYDEGASSISSESVIVSSPVESFQQGLISFIAKILAFFRG